MTANPLLYPEDRMVMGLLRVVGTVNDNDIFAHPWRSCGTR